MDIIKKIILVLSVVFIFTAFMLRDYLFWGLLFFVIGTAGLLYSINKM
jgi:hypothetical protein